MLFSPPRPTAPPSDPSMATRLSESRVDHDGESLPEGVYALVNPRREVVSYKVRWREQDDNGGERQRSKSFARRELGSLEQARAAAIRHREGCSRSSGPATPSRDSS